MAKRRQQTFSRAWSLEDLLKKAFDRAASQIFEQIFRPCPKCTIPLNKIGDTSYYCSSCQTKWIYEDDNVASETGLGSSPFYRKESQPRRDPSPFKVRFRASYKPPFSDYVPPSARPAGKRARQQRDEPRRQQEWYAPRARARPQQQRQAPPPRQPAAPPDGVAAAWKTLGLDPRKSTLADVKKRRRELARQLHGDLGHGKASEEKLKTVNAAADLLLEKVAI